MEINNFFSVFCKALYTCSDESQIEWFNPDYALGIVARRKRAKKTRAFEGLFGDAIVTLW